MTTQQNLKEFTAAESTRLTAERKQRAAEKGLRDFLKLPRGLHVVQFIDEVPVPNALYPERMNFAVKYDGKEWAWSISVKSPMYRQLVECLASGENTFEVLRSGEGLATRYELTPVPANRVVG